MNPTADKLHSLVHSMSKSEKGFFKKQSSAYSSKTDLNYLKLFDAISKQEEYDEEKLLKKFKKETFAKQFAVTKKYLFDNILRNIRTFELENKSSQKIDELKTDAELLVQRSLYKEALRYIQKAKKAAYEIEYLSVLLDLLELERKVAGIYYPKDHIHRKEAINNERQQVLQELKDIFFYIRNMEYIHSKLSEDIYLRNPDVKQELAELLASPMYTDDSRATTLRAQICFWGAHRAFFKATKEHHKSIKAQEKLALAWDSRPTLKLERPLHYLNTLCNYLNNLYENGEIETYQKEFAKLKLISNLSPAQKLLKTRRTFIYELYLMALTHDYSQLSKIATAVQTFIKRQDAAIHVSEQSFLLFQIMYAHVIVGKFDKALDWNLQLMDLVLESDYWDLQHFTQLFNNIIHFELGNLELLPSILQSTKRFLKKHPTYPKFEQLLLQLLAKADTLYFTYNAKELYQKFLTQFADLQEDNSEKGAFQYFDAHCWVLSKINKKTMVDIYRTQS